MFTNYTYFFLATDIHKMSFRSKKTFAAASDIGNASDNKQQTPVADSSLKTSQALKHPIPATSQLPKHSSFATPQPTEPACSKTSQPTKLPCNPSASKWGPFHPPIPRTSQTFGYIAEPIKPSLAAKNMTKFTLTPSLKSTQPSMPELPSSLQKSDIRNSNSQCNLTQPTLEIPKQSTVHTTQASSQQQGNLNQSKSMASNQKLKFAGSQQQHIFTGRQHNAEATSAPQQQQRKSSVSLQQKEVEFMQKEVQQPSLKRAPAMCPNIGTKPSLEKRVAAASMGATKPQMSPTPPTLQTMTSEKNQAEKDVNSESIQPFQSKVPNPYMHETLDTQHMERSSPHIESELRQNHSLVESSSDSGDFNEVENRDSSLNDGKSSKPRRRKRTIVPNWPEKVTFDEKDEVLAYGKPKSSIISFWIYILIVALCFASLLFC